MFFRRFIRPHGTMTIKVGFVLLCTRATEKLCLHLLFIISMAQAQRHFLVFRLLHSHQTQQQKRDSITEIRVISGYYLACALSLLTLTIKVVQVAINSVY